MKKNILISLSIIGVLLALVVGGTRAVFFDREVAERNIFQAGYINLQLNDGVPDHFYDGAKYTWRTPTNSPWVPGGTISNTLRLRNNGNINAGRATIHTNVIVTNVNRARDIGFPDRTDMATRIIVTQATFGETDVTGLRNKTLRELHGQTIDLPGAGIPRNAYKPLVLKFRFHSTTLEEDNGYQGDKVEVVFTFGLYQR